MRNDSQYPTIRQAAKRGPLSEHSLRMMQKQGKLPGFFVGRHFRVNYTVLLSQLNSMSGQSVSGGTCHE